jgi:hypothetical protein
MIGIAGKSTRRHLPMPSASLAAPGVAVNGIHYPQEDSPREIGAAVAQWLKSQRE